MMDSFFIVPSFSDLRLRVSYSCYGEATRGFGGIIALVTERSKP